MIRGVIPGEFLVRCHPVFQILILFQTKKCHFSQPFSDLALRTYDIITYIRMPTKGLLQNQVRFAFYCFFLIQMELKRQLHSYPPIATLDTINYSRPKWAKSPPLFRPKWCKNHTLWDGTYLYGLYKGVPPPPP